MSAGTLREAVERLAEHYEFAASAEPEIAGPLSGAARDLRALLTSHHDERETR